MAWVRVGQLSAETQSLASVDQLGSTGTTPVISSAQKYTGDYSYQVGGVNRPVGFGNLTVNAFRCHAFIRHGGEIASNRSALIGARVDGTDLVCGVSLAYSEFAIHAGYLENTTDINQLAIASSNVISLPNVWYSVGMVAKTGANGFCSVYVDGSLIVDYTGGITAYRTNSNIPRTVINGVYALGNPDMWSTISSFGGWGSLTYIDDFYCDVWEGAGDPDNAPPSSRRFLVAFPTGPGAETQWTPSAGVNWENVDEAPPDSETTWNKALTPGLRDTYEMSNIVVPEDHVVRAVIPMALIRKSDAGVDIQAKLLIDDTTYVLGGGPEPGPSHELTVSYGYIWDRLTVDKVGAEWTEASVNTTDIGVESAGSFA